jgi:hypothetical protein
MILFRRKIMEFEIPLIIPMATKYFDKAKDNNKDLYYRVLDIRLCLEKIADSMIFEFVTDKTQEEWHNYSLHKKLLASKEFLDAKIVDDLIFAKRVGNSGVHKGEETEVSDSEIELSLLAVSNFSIEIFVAYFKKYGFHNKGDSAWVPTILSTLPPSYRIRILEQYFDFDNSVLVIDKLAMAYLKNDMVEQCVKFIMNCYKDELISGYQYSELIEKMKLLKENLHKFSIAKNLEMSKENFENLMDIIPENQRGKFGILVSMILGNDLTVSIDTIA